MNKLLLLTSGFIFSSIAVQAQTVATSNITQTDVDALTNLEIGGFGSSGTGRDSLVNTGPTDNSWLGQTFAVGAAFTLDKIVFEVSGTRIDAGADGAAFTLNLYEFTNTVDLIPNEPAISTQTGIFGNFSGVGNDFLLFDLTDVALSASTQYGVVLSFDSAAADREIDFRNQGTYANGVGIQSDDQGVTWDPVRGDGASSLVFGVYSAVPEPSSFALLAGLGVLGLVAVRRRRS